jgi:hypothetical protein
MPYVARQRSVHSVVVSQSTVLQIYKNQSGLLSSLFRLDKTFVWVVSAGISALKHKEENMTTITI